MTREELMKMSKKELKNRLATLAKDAQAKTGDDLTSVMDEAKNIGEILDEVKAKEDLMAAAKAAADAADGTDPTDGDGKPGESGEAKDQVRSKRGALVKAGSTVKYNAKTLSKGVKNLTSSQAVMPVHTSSEIAPGFNDVSSLVDRVKTVPLAGGESYKRPYVKSYGDGAGSTTEGADYNASEPVFGYAAVEREKITAYCEEPEEMVKLPDADYDGVVEESTTKAVKRYASRQILIGAGTTGKFRGIFHNPTETEDQVIDPLTDIEIADIDDATLDEIIYSYGGDEDVEDVAVLILNKKDLKKFAKLRDKQGRKVYTIKNHGNTGTIDEVPYVINCACGATEAAAVGNYVMAYGPLSNYEVAIFSDLEASKSSDYKFKQGMIAYKAVIFMGGNVVAKNGFIRAKKKAVV